jgi:hypothetical protein
MDNSNQPETDLTEAESNLAQRVIGNIPSIALPRGGMGFGRNPETFEHVIEILDSVGEHLRKSMRENADLRGQLDRENRKKAIAGGYLRDLLTAGTRPSTEVVYHREAEDLINFIGHTTDWQDKRWRISTVLPGERPTDVKIELTRVDGGQPQFYELTVSRNAPVDIYPPEGE